MRNLPQVVLSAVCCTKCEAYTVLHESSFAYPLWGLYYEVGINELLTPGVDFLDQETGPQTLPTLLLLLFLLTDFPFPKALSFLNRS